MLNPPAKSDEPRYPLSLGGILRKLHSRLEQPVRYALLLDDQRVELAPLIGRSLALRFGGEIHCLGCGRRTKKSFNQGYCFVCSQKLAECDLCIVRPERCHFHLGTCRQPEWGLAHCFQPHYVYLANSSGLKVGITRRAQVPTRWIDQGAIQALPILQTASRYQAGLIEVALARQVADKSDWRKLLKGDPAPLDLPAERDRLLALVAGEIKAIEENFPKGEIISLPDSQTVEITYPIKTYPTKINALNFDKQAEIQAVLTGVKGQYLILDCGVLNIRKFGGYRIILDIP